MDASILEARPHTFQVSITWPFLARAPNQGSDNQTKELWINGWEIHFVLHHLLLTPFQLFYTLPKKVLNTKSSVEAVYDSNSYRGTWPLSVLFCRGMIPLGMCEKGWGLFLKPQPQTLHATNSDFCIGSWTSWFYVWKNGLKVHHMFSNELAGTGLLPEPHSLPEQGPLRRGFRRTAEGGTHKPLRCSQFCPWEGFQQKRFEVHKVAGTPERKSKFFRTSVGTTY